MKKISIFAMLIVMAASCDRSWIDTAALDGVCAAVFAPSGSIAPEPGGAEPAGWPQGPDTAQGQPGAAVLVMKGDKVVFEKCYGLADLETGAPITPETSFNIASVSKQFTAVAVLQLCEQGKISLEDNVNKYFPEFTDPIWDRIKVRHLLAHSSGIPDARKGYTREERLLADDVRAIEYLPKLNFLHFEPGTQYEYMNPTFVLAGSLVERVTGQPFTDYVAEHIFAPAGMDRTRYFDPDAQELIPNMSHGYVLREGEWRERDYGEESFFATRPDGGIYTSVREFAKWELAQRGNMVLKAETLLDAQSPKTLVSGSSFSDYQNRDNTWYGYGWFIEPQTADSEKVVYHTGDNGGFMILAARYPESETLVLVFANRCDWDRYRLMQDIERLVL